MRDSIFVDNEFHDMLYLDILRSEWFQQLSDFLIKFLLEGTKTVLFLQLFLFAERDFTLYNDE